MNKLLIKPIIALSYVTLLLSLTFCKFCSAQPDVQKLLLQVQLPTHFLLRYNAIRIDARSQIMKKFLESYIRSEHDENVKIGKETSEAAEAAKRQATSILQTSPPIASLVTEAEADKKLFYKLQSGNYSFILIFDGKKSFIYEQSDGKHGHAIVENGFSAYRMSPFVLPAAAMTNIPLIINAQAAVITNSNAITLTGQSPVFGGGNANTIDFEPSEVTLATQSEGVKALNCVIKNGSGQMEQRWDYQTFSKFGAIQISNRSMFTDFQGYEDAAHHFVVAPSFFSKYTLQEANTIVPKYLFDPKTWLQDGDSVQDNQGQTIVSYEYHHERGDIDAQTTRARWHEKQRLNSINDGNVQGNRSGAFLFLAAIGAALIWYWWKIRNKTSGEL